MSTTGPIDRYEVSLEERWPTLLVLETPRVKSEDLLVGIPERLVRRLRDARAAHTEAENEVARWVKYSGTALERAALQPIIDRLPTAEERKAARKR